MAHEKSFARLNFKITLQTKGDEKMSKRPNEIESDKNSVQFKIKNLMISSSSQGYADCEVKYKKNEYGHSTEKANR